MEEKNTTAQPDAAFSKKDGRVQPSGKWSVMNSALTRWRPCFDGAKRLLLADPRPTPFFRWYIISGTGKLSVHMFLELTNDTAAHHSALQLLSLRV